MIIIKPGTRFGRLTVIEFSNVAIGRRRKWKCQCECGAVKIVYAQSLRSGATISCGCFALEKAIKHGDRCVFSSNGTPEYVCWKGMKQRCHNPNGTGYKEYGERGIIVCERWRKSFQNFLDDMGRKPTAEHSIDRLNVDGNYEPSNCRWATKKEQRANQRKMLAA